MSETKDTIHIRLKKQNDMFLLGQYFPGVLKGYVLETAS
jgi:hypothetical protein